jgi:hypothetical protein
MMLARYGTLFLVTLPLLAVEPAPLPLELQQAKKMFLVNSGVENSIQDRVYDMFSKWSRWTMVNSPEEADVIAILSRQDNVAILESRTSSTTATAAVSPGVAIARASSTQTSTPMIFASYDRFLTVISQKTGARLVSVSCQLRLAQGRTGKHLMDRLKNRFPKPER